MKMKKIIAMLTSAALACGVMTALPSTCKLSATREVSASTDLVGFVYFEYYVQQPITITNGYPPYDGRYKSVVIPKGWCNEVHIYGGRRYVNVKGFGLVDITNYINSGTITTSIIFAQKAR